MQNHKIYDPLILVNQQYYVYKGHSTADLVAHSYPPIVPRAFVNSVTPR